MRDWNAARSVGGLGVDRAAVAVGLGVMLGFAMGVSAQGTAATGPGALDTLLRILGRTHPILVHFPIALVLVAAMIETARAMIRRPTPARTSVNMLGLGVLAAGAAIGSGWMNGDYENHASVAETMELHRWIGIGGGAAALVAYLFGLAASRSRRALMAFRAVLLVSAGAIGFTGHLGGRMVYGEGYLLAPLSMGRSTPQENGARAEPPSAAGPVSSGTVLSGPPVTGAVKPQVDVGSVSFERDVLPIFEAMCVECHGESKAKASMRLDSLAHVMRAEPWVLSADAPAESDLLMRIRMNERDDGAMPPKGERLSALEIATIEAWIGSLAEGAGELMPREEPAAERLQESDGSGSEIEWTDEQASAIEGLRARGARIEPVSAESERLDVNLSRLTPRCDATAIAMLQPVIERVERLDLSGAAIGDADLEGLSTAGAMRWLSVDRTEIGDGSASVIAALPALGVLVATGTELSDAGLRLIAASGSIERVYAAGSGVTEAGAASVAAEVEVVLASAPRPTVVYLVRHAEKQAEGSDPSLNEEGKSRAQALVRSIAGQRVRAVYVTQYARTRETAAPLAESLGLSPVALAANRDVAAHANDVASAIRGLPSGSVAVVVGHSNTIPAIIRALGVPDALEIDESRYGDLYTVELTEGGSRLLETGRFGP